MASKKQIRKDSCRVFTDTDPVTIQAAITDYCLNKCFMCDHYKRTNKTSINGYEWIAFLKHLKDTKTVFYTGGDAIIHQDINKIMEAHLSLGIDYGFISTGYIPQSVDMQLLAQAKFFNVSLDSIDIDNYKELRGGITLDKVYTSIIHAISYGVNVGLTCVISEQNLHELPDLLDFASQFNLKIRLNFLHGHEALEVTDILNNYRNIGVDVDVKVKKYEFKQCFVPYYSMFVDAYGDVYPCCIMAGDTEISPVIEPLGNISNWYEAKLKRYDFNKSKLHSKCSNCLPSFTKINNELIDFKETDIISFTESHNFY